MSVNTFGPFQKKSIFGCSSSKQKQISRRIMSVNKNPKFLVVMLQGTRIASVNLKKNQFKKSKSIQTNSKASISFFPFLLVKHSSAWLNNSKGFL